jgi:hypothetical protein
MLSFGACVPVEYWLMGAVTAVLFFVSILVHELAYSRRKHPSTIESTRRSIAYRMRPLDRSVLFMPGVSGLRQQLQLANDFQHQCEIVQAG